METKNDVENQEKNETHETIIQTTFHIYICFLN